MKINVSCRLYVLGIDFWQNVIDIFGGAIATAGQSQLLNKWGHNKGFNYDLFKLNETEINVECTLQTPELKRKVIHKNIKFNGNTEMILQLECDDNKIGIFSNILQLQILHYLLLFSLLEKIYFFTALNLLFQKYFSEMHLSILSLLPG